MTAPVWIDEHVPPTPSTESFYVPDMMVEAGVDEGNMRPVHDVVRVSFTDKVNEIDSFEFTVANGGWAPDVGRYTNSFPAPQSSASTEPPPPSLLPGVRVRLWLGYVSEAGMTPMLTGRVVSVNPQFSARGASVTIRCLSTLEELRDGPKTQRWPRQGRGTIRDTEIAREIATARDVTLVLPAGYDEPAHRTITQRSETDIAFLIRRATERGYVVCFRERPANPTSPQLRRTMYFGPSNLLGRSEREQLGDRVQPYIMQWGGSLIEFSPTLNLSTTLWKSVKLSFWDRRARRRVPLTYSLDELWADEAGLNRDLEPVVADAAIAVHELPRTPLHSRDEAMALLRNKLRENFLKLLTARGSTIGLPELRACSQIEVRGIGAPFDGSWFVTSTTHTFDDNGYTTSFESRREQRNQGSS